MLERLCPRLESTACRCDLISDSGTVRVLDKGSHAFFIEGHGDEQFKVVCVFWSTAYGTRIEIDTGTA